MHATPAACMRSWWPRPSILSGSAPTPITTGRRRSRASLLGCRRSPSCRSHSCSTYSGDQGIQLWPSKLSFASRSGSGITIGQDQGSLPFFYDPRSLEPHTPGGILHAKAVIADDEAAFVTSANLTEAAFDRNIEVGVLTRDHAFAASLARHFGTLIERGLLLPLPSRTPPS